MTAIAGALGSVIGYLGGEVAEATMFERLLWPQRLYNNPSVLDLLKISALFPMGGPLHSAALKTLDAFRDNGLYSSYYQGHLLGTAFYLDSNMRYSVHGASPSSGALEVRNGFWVEVLRRVRPKEISAAALTDAENPLQSHRPPRRARQVVYHLCLSQGSDIPPKPHVVVINEDRVTWHVALGVAASELSAIGLAIFIGVYEGLIWLAVYLCVPLMLKAFAVMFSVDREPLQEPPPDSTSAIFEISTGNRDFMLIEGPSAVVRQFFVHYGHPKRSRWREVLSILLVYCFVLYFPAGLVSLLWMDPTIQYLWLGYQVYAIFVMHIVRVFGLTGIGRTEDYIARALWAGKDVRLSSRNSQAVLAHLKWTVVPGVREGQAETVRIIEEFKQSKILL